MLAALESSEFRFVGSLVCISSPRFLVLRRFMLFCFLTLEAPVGVILAGDCGVGVTAPVTASVTAIGASAFKASES